MCFCVSPGACLASELSFLLEPSDVIAVRERPLLLDCRVQGEEPIMVTWRRNGMPLPSSARVRVLVNGTLLIRSFQKRRDGSDGDIGEYDCTAQNRYGMLVSRKAKVLLACKYFRSCCDVPEYCVHQSAARVSTNDTYHYQLQTFCLVITKCSHQTNQ